MQGPLHAALGGRPVLDATGAPSTALCATPESDDRAVLVLFAGMDRPDAAVGALLTLEAAVARARGDGQDAVGLLCPLHSGATPTPSEAYRALARRCRVAWRLPLDDPRGVPLAAAAGAPLPLPHPMIAVFRARTGALHTAAAKCALQEPPAASEIRDLLAARPLLDASGAQVTSVLEVPPGAQDKAIVLLFCSGGACAGKEQLCAEWRALRETGRASFEMVLCPLDATLAGYTAAASGVPFPRFAFGDRRVRELAEALGVAAVPTLVTVSAATGSPAAPAPLGDTTFPIDALPAAPSDVPVVKIASLAIGACLGVAVGVAALRLTR